MFNAAPLHPLSAAFGFVIAALLALTTSQASPPPATLNPASIRIEYMPHPRDMVQIKEGTPYTVPAGKLFVLTGLGAVSMSSSTSLLVDSIKQLETRSFVGNMADLQPSVANVALGFTVAAGSTIDVGLQPGGTGRAWGYLASQ